MRADDYATCRHPPCGDNPKLAGVFFLGEAGASRRRACKTDMADGFASLRLLLAAHTPDTENLQLAATSAQAAGLNILSVRRAEAVVPMVQYERATQAEAEHKRAEADALLVSLSEAITVALAADQAAQEARARLNEVKVQQATQDMINAAIVANAAAKMLPNMCPSTHPYAYLRGSHCCRTRFEKVHPRGARFGCRGDPILRDRDAPEWWQITTRWMSVRGTGITCCRPGGTRCPCPDQTTSTTSTPAPGAVLSGALRGRLHWDAEQRTQPCKKEVADRDSPAWWTSVRGPGSKGRPPRTRILPLGGLQHSSPPSAGTHRGWAQEYTRNRPPKAQRRRKIRSTAPRKPRLAGQTVVGSQRHNTLGGGTSSPRAARSSHAIGSLHVRSMRCPAVLETRPHINVCV